MEEACDAGLTVTILCDRDYLTANGQNSYDVVCEFKLWVVQDVVVDAFEAGGNEQAAAPRRPSGRNAGTEHQSRSDLWLRSGSGWWRTVVGEAAQAVGTTPMCPR